MQTLRSSFFAFSLLFLCFFFATASIKQFTLVFQLLNGFVWISINLINLHQYKIAYRNAATLLLERHAQGCILPGAQTNASWCSAVCPCVTAKWWKKLLSSLPFMRSHPFSPPVVTQMQRNKKVSEQTRTRGNFVCNARRLSHLLIRTNAA